VTYNVYFGTNNPPSNISNGTNTDLTTYNPGTLTGNTTYYWRIDCTNAGGTTAGIVWSFTTEILAPDRVGSPTPGIDEGGVSIDQQLRWGAVSGATYNVYFGTNNPPSNIINGTNTASITFDPGTLTGNTTYYWRIDSTNVAGTTAGIVWSFTTGASNNDRVYIGGAGDGWDWNGSRPPAQVGLTNPVNGATDVSINPQLSWGAVSGATYNVYLGTDNPPSNIINGTNTASITFDSGTLTGSTTYYWRIDSTNAGGTTVGIVWSFTTSEPPDRVVYIAPVDGATDVPIDQQLSWGAVSGATYNVYLGTDNPPSNIINGTNTDSTTTDLGTLTDDTAYYWRIDSTNAVSGTTAGFVWSFTTIVALPDQVGSPTPGNGDGGVSINPQLTWGAEGGATTTYDVWFNGSFVQNQAENYYSPPSLEYSTGYSWRIDSVNAVGTTTGPDWGFTTEAIPVPDQVSSPSPYDGETNISINPQLTWGEASNATSYDVYFNGSGIGNQTDLFFNPGSLSSGTTYSWRIDSVGPGGTTTGLDWSFTTGE